MFTRTLLAVLQGGSCRSRGLFRKNPNRLVEPLKESEIRLESGGASSTHYPEGLRGCRGAAAIMNRAKRMKCVPRRLSGLALCLRTVTRVRRFQSLLSMSGETQFRNQPEHVFSA